MSATDGPSSLADAALELVPEAVIQLDGDGNITHWNKSAERIFGYTASEVIGRDLHSIVVAPRAHGKMPHMQRALKTFKTTGELPFVSMRDVIGVRKNGEEFPSEVSLASVEVNGSWHVVGIVRDLSEKKKLEETRFEVERQLMHAAKMASIGTLAGGVAHEINNPLAVVKGNLVMLREELQKDSIAEYPAKLLEKIEAAADRIATVVNGLRTYARADTERLENVDVHAAIKAVLALTDYGFKKAGITIEMQLEAARFFVRGNDGRFQQILMTLFSNAKDALEGRPEGRIVAIQTKNLPGRTGGQVIELSVSDNGAGMATDVLPRIFDAFYTTKEPGKGAGLGLAIAQSIVASMNGHISARSKVGAGSTLTLAFPVVAVEQAMSVLDSKSDKKNGPVLKGALLVVDDEEEIRLIVTHYLKNSGLRVDVACDAEEALKRIEVQKYDYVLTDLKLPRMSGVELIEKGRKLTGTGTKYMIITGGLPPDQETQTTLSAELTADGYLTKPFDRRQLLKALENLK